jgi:hypothetical protein
MAGRDRRGVAAGQSGSPGDPPLTDGTQGPVSRRREDPLITSEVVAPFRFPRRRAAAVCIEDPDMSHPTLVTTDAQPITPGDLPTNLLPEVTALPITLSEEWAMLPFVEARERALREFDRAFLRAALARHDGNIARTARALGLHRQSLQKLLVRRALR